jgi:PPK2 family polyphosphate:nucleotide phosphotransferase
MNMLAEMPTRAPESIEKEAAKQQNEQLFKRIGELQYLLFAEAKHSVLVILQGLDAAGKGGVIQDVFSQVNLAGCRVKNFQKPSAEEAAHDFLWRIHQHTPPKGWLQVFDRSQYEDILVPLAEGWITQPQAERRLKHILAFESNLQDTGTQVLKFFLHVSPEVQLERLNERVTNPQKRWKYNAADLDVFQKRDRYLEIYDWIFRTTQKHYSDCAQWTIVPADQNWYKESVVANELVRVLEALNMQFPASKRV